MKIAVAGIGYVGLSNAILLSQHNDVRAVDIQEERIRMVNDRVSPVADSFMTAYLRERNLSLSATSDGSAAYQEADWIVIATPTDYRPEKGSFDTSSVESVLGQIDQCGSRAAVVIKSTVPIGYTVRMQKLFPRLTLLFSPEFLREGKALYDNLHPSRIIVGTPDESPELRRKASVFADMLKASSLETDTPVLITGSNEAESIKLFANTYLAMRVAFFNELDTYAQMKDFSSRDIIRGLCFDPRIGHFYNNPSFGYGGYCLPKDTRQLMADFKGIPSALIPAVVSSNEIRKSVTAEQIEALHPQCVGIYRLTMKSQSDNFRSSAIQSVIRLLQEKNIPMLIYEPILEGKDFSGIPSCGNLDVFKKKADLIVANRMDKELDDVRGKVYTRDLFSRD
jgi:UDPglucose 6-dehydrogenase